MKNLILGLITFLMPLAFYQCGEVITTVEDVSLIVENDSGTAISGASVKVNEDIPALTDSSGDAGEFDLSTGDSITYTASGYKNVTVYLEDPILLQSLTVHLETSTTAARMITGEVTFNGSPCGIDKIINLDKPMESTNCNSLNGEYNLAFSTPSPFRIGYVSNNNGVLKLKIKTDSDNTKMDVGMDSSTGNEGN